MKKAEHDWSLLSDEELIDTALPNWNTLHAVLSKLTNRRQVAVLLAAEIYGERRDPIIERIHQRLGRMRTSDELKQLRHIKTIKPSLHDMGLDWLLGEL